MAMLVASAFTAVMVVLEFIDHHSRTSIGLWLTLVASLVAAYGAFEMGGRIAMPCQQLVLVASAGRRRASYGPPPAARGRPLFKRLDGGTRLVTEAFASPNSIDVFGS